jgi:16S rRNA (uracil1498-N3)-methyltransferase
MHRFFVEPALLASSSQNVKLPEAVAHQVRDVLRLAIGEQVILLANSGDEVLASLVQSSRAAVTVQLLERRPGKSESPVRIVLCQGLLKSVRFEWMLEKGTELGVSVVVPTFCRRSMAGLEDAGEAKMQRWRRIIQEAAEQCGRARLPELTPIRPLMHALNDIPPGSLALLPWEEERDLTLRTALLDFQHAHGEHHLAEQEHHMTVIVFIGPEGGFMAEEVQLARRHGVQVVTLGPRILRAETAALATVANIMYALEST